MIPISIELRLSAEALSLGHEIVAAIGHLADAIKANGDRAPAFVPSDPADDSAPEEIAQIQRHTNGLALDTEPEGIASPAPTPSSAPAFTPAPPALITWTDERLAVLRRDFRTNRPRLAIFEDLNRLPGKPISSVGSMAARASSMGLRSLDRGSPLPPAPPAAPYHVTQPKTRMEALTTISAAISAAIAGPPVVADFRSIANWAAPRGLQCDDKTDLPAINAKRVQLGLPRFVLPERFS